MALIIRGEDIAAGPVPVRFSEGRRNSDGTVETDVTYAVSTDYFWANFATWPARGVTEHPHSAAFKADIYTWTTPVQGVTLVRVLFIAVIPVELTPGEALPLDVEEEASNSITEEPVTTLRNFLKSYTEGAVTYPAIVPVKTSAGVDTNWPTVTIGADTYPVTVDPATGRWPASGGQPLVAQNGAVFDTFGQNNNPLASDYNPNVGRFLYFAPGSPFVGQEAYVRPVGEWAFSYATTTQPNLSNVGKIGTPPGLPEPTDPINYLLSAMAYRRTGFVYRARQGWRRSGPRGWNESIYPPVV